MKLVFEGHSLANLRDQMLSAAREIEGSDVGPRKVQEPDIMGVGANLGPTMNETAPIKFDLPPNNSYHPVVTQVPVGGFEIDRIANDQRTTEVNNTGVNLDTRGVPWDERIHAGTKTKLPDGTWRYKRGVQDPEIAQVEAQIAPHATKVKKAPPFGSMTTEQYQAVVTPPMPTTNNVVHMPQAVQQQAPVAPPVVADPIPMPQAAPANNVYNRDSFRKNLPMCLASLVQQGKIDRNYIAALAQHFKVKDLAEVAGNERDCNILFDQLVNYKFITGV